MPSSSPPSFLGHAGPKNPLSHERILRICNAYKTLHARYLDIGGTLDAELYETMLDIERESIAWEQRSAKLRYEAKRQQAYRASKRAPHNEHSTRAALTGFDYDRTNPAHRASSFAPPPDYSSDDAKNDLFADEPPAPSAPLTSLPTSTLDAITKFRNRHANHPDAPDTSGYKKSGLV